MKIVDSSVWTKEELVDIVNHILNLEHEFSRKAYVIDCCFTKQQKLFDDVDKLLRDMKSKSLEEIFRIHDEIDKIYKEMDKIRDSIVVDERGE